MKMKNCKKTGISMVALVITIIVLIILTAAVVITGVNAPQQAQLAVNNYNKKVIIEDINTKIQMAILNKAMEGVYELQTNEVQNILNEYAKEETTFDKNTLKLTTANAGEIYLYEIMKVPVKDYVTAYREGATVTIADRAEVDLSSEYIIQYTTDNGTTWVNNDTPKEIAEGTEIQVRLVKLIEGIETVISDTMKVSKINAKVVQNDPYKYYGAHVNYTAGGQSNWRIFYADNNNIYITTEIPVDVGTNLQNYYNIISTDENGRNEIVNKLRANNTNYVNSTYAEWAHDGIRYEMFKDSYNQVRGSNEPQNLTVTNGVVTYEGNSVSKLSEKQLELYTWTYDSNKSRGYNFYWLASPLADSTGCVMSVNSNGNTVHYRSYSNSAALGIRPLVCLKSDVQLVESGVVDARGYMTYNISI